MPKDFGNYASYDEYRDLADIELRREVAAGFAEVFPTRAAMEEAVGPSTPSKVGVIVKEKGGRVKVRLIHDLSRSGVNQQVTLPERIVLPRLSDVVANLLKLLRSRSPTNEVECAVLDFKDAFKQLQINPSEPRYLSGCFSGGWFLYLRILFGIVCGPLVWGRVAAAIMRATQSLAPPTALRLACFVDDPFLVAFGTAAARSEYLAVATSFWCSLGFRLSWRKGYRGSEVPWIGALLKADNRVRLM
jgi:hypothetical protein